MESKITKPDVSEENQNDREVSAPSSSTYKISAHPVVGPTNESSPREPLPSPLPRSYGSETLTLLARDPHTIFVFWDIDWEAAFRDLEPKSERKISLRLFNSDGAEQSATEVETLAGNCSMRVANAAATYRGEIGYRDANERWISLATSEVVTTPPETAATATEADFATVPFHLSFQRMVDLLQARKRENETLLSLLSDLRERVAADETDAHLTAEQRELGRTMQHLHQTVNDSSAARPRDPRLQQKLERILGFGASSPHRGFGGSSSTR